MKRGTGNLWASIVFIGVLIVGSVGAFVGGIHPVLGLDLQGGVSVTLLAPPGTSKDVMEQALENIRNRVDAFGVGEPELFLNGTTIEVQLPGLANGTVEQRGRNQYCLIGQGGTSYGCFDTQADAQTTLSLVKPVSDPLQVCLVSKGGKQGDCFDSQSQADAAKAALTVGPKPSPTPSAGASATPTPTAFPTPTTGPAPPRKQFCVNDPSSGTTYGCFKSQSDAQGAQSAVTTKVTKEQFCLSTSGTAGSSVTSTASPPPTPAPTPTGKAKPSPSSTPSPSPSPTSPPAPTPNATAGEQQLPCFPTKDRARAGLASIEATRETQQFCVISSAGTNLGCYLTQPLAEAQRQATGQDRLIQIIGTTARLEERPVLATLPASDPTPVTCPTPEEQRTPPCSFKALQNKPVVYLSKDGAAKYRLGPAAITGGAIKKATAVYNTGQSSSPPGWAISFQLTSSGAKAFGDITTQLAPQHQQLAIVLDRQVISAPSVQGAITGGNGIITGQFTAQRAKDLATQLNSGALPVELQKGQVQTVSATLGKASLKQGLIAGIVGLVMLMLYLAFYYRLLGIVTWLGMAIWATLALALVSVFGRAGYTLSLAGVAGLVVSLGITADSYIVFYERLKDEVRHGKTPRSAIQPAFRRAFRTILTADAVTFLAAVILYLVTVSSVRGFALTLGVATVLDVFVVYFFKRPTVFLIARSARLVNLRGFGLQSGVAADPVPGVAGGSR